MLFSICEQQWEFCEDTWMLLAQETPALYAALEVLVPLAHSGAVWIYVAGFRWLRILQEYCPHLVEGIFRAMYLSRLTDGKDNENAIGLFAECWHNLLKSQNFFWKKVMLLEKHITWVVLISFFFLNWRQIYPFKCTGDCGIGQTFLTQNLHLVVYLVCFDRSEDFVTCTWIFCNSKVLFFM